ncbi:MAG: type II toxin-antitoxin system RelE/ParE family toxin [Pseudomonadota bacterium]|nr:type II toxin-antitoxin system RelE/ParE family toxin [Pseudomonadota bacterium]
MAVTWSPLSIEDRHAIWFALYPINPSAADRQDAAIEAEGDALDGPATYQAGPTSSTHTYTCKGGRFVILYSRNAHSVVIKRVRPSASSWRDANGD